MLCRKCRYPLRGLASRHCPECGTAFDPNDPQTWRQPRRLWSEWSWLLAFPAGWLVMLGVYLVPFVSGRSTLVFQWEAALLAMVGAGTILGGVLGTLVLVVAAIAKALSKLDGKS